MKNTSEKMKLLEKVEKTLEKYGISAIGPGHRLAFGVIAARQKGLVENGRFDTIRDFVVAAAKVALEYGIFVSETAMERALYRAIKRINGKDEHDLWGVCLRLAEEYEDTEIEALE